MGRSDDTDKKKQPGDAGSSSQDPSPTPRTVGSTLTDSLRQAWQRISGHIKRELSVRRNSMRAEFRCRCVNSAKGYWFEARMPGRYDPETGTMTVATSDIPRGRNRTLDLSTGKVVSMRDGSVIADAQSGDVIVFQSIRTKFL